MNIAHVSATFPPYQGGTGNVCFHNACELARRGHEVHVFTALSATWKQTGSAPAYEVITPFGQEDGITVHRLRPLVQVGNAPLLPQLLWSLRGFDVIHLHYPFFGGEITTLAAKLTRTPLVVTYHQDVLLINPITELIATALRHSVGQLTLRAADRLLFTSRDYGEASYVRPMLRGRESAIGELPNGVDIERFSPGDAGKELKTSYQLTSDDKVALLVATLDRAHDFKGVNIFLKALAELPRQVKGVIVGDGNLRSTYEATASTLALSERVFFAGRVSYADLPHYYRLADVTVLPSITMSEAFGLVLVESLASGTPVIASNLPGVRTVVAEKKDGFLVNPGDHQELAIKLNRILSLSASARRIMGLKGRRKVEVCYSWQSIGKQLEAIYYQAQV